MTRSTTHRRWSELYGALPGAIEPASKTALEMFRATVSRRRDSALVHYFDRSISAGQLDAMSDSLAVPLGLLVQGSLMRSSSSWGTTTWRNP